LGAILLFLQQAPQHPSNEEEEMRFDSWRLWSSLSLSALSAFMFMDGCTMQGGAGDDELALQESAVTSSVTGSVAISSDWGGGYCANVTISNGGSSAITSWTAVIQMNQSAMSSIWSATGTQSGSSLTALPASFNAALAAGTSTTFGFCANATGTPYQATTVSVTASGGTTTGSGGSGAGGKTGSGGSGAGGSGAGGKTGSGGAGTGGATGSGGCSIPSFVSAQPSPIGWAALNGGTTGGGNATPVVVTTLSAFNSAANGTTAAVIYVKGNLGQGTATIGSNKTIIGCSGTTPTLSGHVGLSTSSNVIVRNMNIVGYNCAPPDVDVTTGGQCQNGQDAVTVDKSSKNIWFDHDAVSDGSDGNLDITHASDFITISYTKFFYSTKRSDPNDTGPMGHRVCNRIGHSDSNTSEDTGHLNVTFHHDWWADNVMERMPRVRFGKVHVFNNLYTATGDSACIEVGVSCNIRSENNVFQGVSNAVDSTHSNAASIIQSIGNVGSATNINAPAFTPPYMFTAEPASSVAASVMAGAGVK
jgi:pectate lyase